MNLAFIHERTPCLPDDILLALSPQVWQQQHQPLLEHLQNLSSPLLYPEAAITQPSRIAKTLLAPLSYT